VHLYTSHSGEKVPGGSGEFLVLYGRCPIKIREGEEMSTRWYDDMTGEFNWKKETGFDRERRKGG